MEGIFVKKHPYIIFAGMKRINFLLLAIAIGLFFTAVFIEKSRTNEPVRYEHLAANASVCLSKISNQSQQVVDDFSKLISQKEATDSNLIIIGAFKNPVEWLSIFVYRNDSLIWWSDNAVMPDAKNIKPGISFHHNGWYEFFINENEKYKTVGMLRIKNQYAFQNRFLSNNFHPELNLPATAAISLKENNHSIPVISNNKIGFYLQFDQTGNHGNELALPAIMFIIAYVLFFVSLYLIIISSNKSYFKTGLIIIPLIIIGRFASIYFTFPVSIYELQLFSPSYYASSFVLNSLGDLLLASVLLAYLISLFYRAWGLKLAIFSSSSTPQKATIIGIGIILFTFLYSALINYLVSGLIINSRISFNINNVFELNIYSLLGVIIIGFLLFSFYLVCDGVAGFIKKRNATLQNNIFIFVLSALIFSVVILISHTKGLFTDYSLTTSALTFLLILYTVIVKNGIGKLNAFTQSLLIIFGLSVYATQTISNFNNEREKENRKLLAGKLENEQDQIAEYLFDDVAANVASDKVVTGFFDNSYEKLLTSIDSSDVIEKRLTQIYFTGYWAKYDISIKSFNKEGLPVNTGGDPTWNLDFFNRKIHDESRKTYSPFLYFSGNASGRIAYVGKIPVYSKSDPSVQTGTIVISLVSKLLQDEAGFPELLLSDKVPQKKDISNYSYAHYRNGMLVNQAGTYNYFVSSNPYEKFCLRNEHEKFVTFDNYSHLFYNTGEKGLLIVSYKNPGLLEFITLFSYLFSFYAICFLIIYSSTGIFKNRGKISINFKNRIQATVIVIVVATMLLIGSATVYYIYRNYVTNLGQTVNDRLKSMLIAIQDELSTRSPGEEMISDELNYSFSKLAATLSIDFNIYSQHGMLVYSTQPKIYDQSLIARMMNREALNNLVGGNKSLHIQYEEIGALRFLSAYEPVRNSNNQTVGYINLPYFAKQDELKRDISSFLIALINIYVLLFSFAVFVTLIISNRITKPLQLIQQRLGRIKLGKRNELIEWDHDDEIGGLVKEYNRMVEELSVSAELLARSERESAWREMAKQVAHEIKNPLTPMKLGAQHLQRAYREKNKDVGPIMERFTQTLIEQIDALSNIATEFSNFAKMPKTHNEPVDVVSVLKNTVTLYSESENANIHLHISEPGNFIVFADKEQLLRIFSNLIKNALQAIDGKENGRVDVEIYGEKNRVQISVSDNGIGIPESEKHKIFTPNFTTKSAGMGLGLAMVKNMMEQSGGQISFESVEGDGTVFKLSLPVHSN